MAAKHVELLDLLDIEDVILHNQTRIVLGHELNNCDIALVARGILEILHLVIEGPFELAHGREVLEA